MEIVGRDREIVIEALREYAAKSVGKFPANGRVTESRASRVRKQARAEDLARDIECAP